MITGDGTHVAWDGSGWTEVVVLPTATSVTPSPIATAATGAAHFTVHGTGLLAYASWQPPGMVLFDPSGPTITGLQVTGVTDTAVDFRKITQTSLIPPGTYTLRFVDTDSVTVAEFPGLLEVTP